MPRRYGSIGVRAEDEEERRPILDVARCDHYGHDDDDDDDRSGSAGSGGGSGGGGSPLAGMRRRRARNARLWRGCWRTLAGVLLLPLLLLTSLSLFYSYRLSHQLTALSSRLDSATSDISALSAGLDVHSAQLSTMNATLANHSAVISRFEDSVSNSDVLRELAQLEAESEEREERVKEEMQNTKREVREVLTATKGEIDATVSNATNQINFQVASVQSSLSAYIRTTQDQFSTENSFMVYQLAGTITLIGCLISMWHMTSHLRNFRQPFVQRKILAILWMCPIYSVTSWLSLVFPQSEGYLAILKDLYEAYVIYQFLSFCIAVLGKGDRNAVVDLLAGHADHLSPPWRCCGCFRKNITDSDAMCEDEKKQLAEDVLLQCQVCAMQFVFLRPMLTAAMFALKKVDYHGPLFGPADDDYSGGMLDYRSPQFYIVILENVSVFLAFSGLLKFYHAVQEDLSWCRPFPKFLCIKGVVFMTFWQGIGISLLANTTDLLSGGDVMGAGDDEDQLETWAMQAQNFLICLEMLGFAIAHFYCFPVEEWEEGYRPVEDKSRFGDKMALGDFVHDLKTILRHNERKKRMAKEKAGIKHSDDSISTVLEEDEELGRTDSSDDGLQSLLENVEGLLEGGGDSTSSIGVSEKRGDANASAPRTHKKSVQESLQDANAPKELRQATALLLAGTLLDEDTARLLTSDILDLPLEAGSLRGGGKGRADEDAPVGEGSKLSPVDGRDDGDASASPKGDEASSASSAASATAEVDAQPSESTLLLSASKIDQMLKPSIFTMHSMDEGKLDREEEKQQPSEDLHECEKAVAESQEGEDKAI